MGWLVFALFVSFVLGIFFRMFGDAAVMHFAVAGRMESAFSLKKVWKPYKANLGKLFCASILPEVLTGIVSNIIMGVFTVIFGSFAALGLSSYGYYGYYSPSGLEAHLVPDDHCLCLGVFHCVWQDAQVSRRWLLGGTSCQ